MATQRIRALEKKARRIGATLLFVDESGFSERPKVVRTWAPRGCTPTLCHNFNWNTLSAISAVSERSKLYLNLHDETIKGPQVASFLRHVMRCVRGRVIGFVDGATIHRTAEVKGVLEEYRGRLWLERLPPYAPEMNPDEWFWSHMKYKELANFCPKDAHELKRGVQKAARRVQNRPGLIRSFIAASGLSR